MSAQRLQQERSKYNIQSQAEENPKMNEVFELLLSAGYFRIRIPSLSTFDKILGSLTWCIACSNFEIDMEYDDEMNLGQKIALSEKIGTALKAMQCPYDLQPFQIRGLDFDKLYPVVHWLIKFVYETRESRWDFNTSMSNFIGKKIYPSFVERQRKEEATIKETTQSIAKPDKRNTKNVNLKTLSMSDPIRIYSTLIEYGDITAYKTYNKLCGVVSGKIDLEQEMKKQQKSSKNSKGKDSSAPGKKKKGDEFDVNSFLFYGGNNEIKEFLGYRPERAEVETSKIAAMVGQQAATITQQQEGGQAMVAKAKKGSLAQMNAMQFGGSEPGSLQQQLQQQIQQQQQQKQSQQQAAEEAETEQVDLQIDETQFRRVERRQSVVGASLMDLIAQNQQEIKETLEAQQDEDENPELELANIVKNEKEFHVGQTTALSKKIALLESKLEQVSEDLYVLKEQEQEAVNYYDQHSNLDQEQKSAKATIDKKLQAAKARSKDQIQEAEKMVEKRNDLKDKRLKLKKSYKLSMQENEIVMEKLKKEKQILEEQEPGEDEAQLYAKKKKKYDKKLEEFSQQNQQAAVLSRKVENFPSASEIAQYQLRLLELYESISSESEKEKDNYIRYNNLCDVKGQILSFVDIMKTFKENYQVHKKSKSGREKFIGDLTDAYKGLEANHAKTVELLTKQRQQRENKQDEITKLRNVERDYFKLLKELRNELEINDTLYQRQ